MGVFNGVISEGKEMKRLVLVVTACVILDWVAYDVVKQTAGKQGTNRNRKVAQLRTKVVRNLKPGPKCV